MASVAKFLTVYPNDDIYGGGERVCHNVIKTHLAHGQKVELLTFDFDASKYRNIVGEGFPKEVTVTRWANTPKNNCPSPFTRGAATLRSCSKNTAASTVRSPFLHSSAFTF